MKKFIRDDTEHGKEYYLALDVDALPQQRSESSGKPAAWVGLAKDDMLEILKEIDPKTQRLPIGFRMFADAIEAKLKEKNTP